MNRSEFLACLAEKLAILPQSEIERLCNFYAEMIDDRMEDNMTEEAAVAVLGNPETIADTILMDTPVSTLVKGNMRSKKTWSVLQILLLVLGAPLWIPLLIAAVVIAFSLYLVLWVLVASFAIVAVALILSGICVFLTAFPMLTMHAPSAVFLFATGCLLVGIALFAFLGVRAMAYGTLRLTAACFRGFKRMLIGERRR